MEGVGHLRDQVVAREIDAVQRHVDLEDLLAVAHVGAALHLDRPVEARETRAPLGFHAGEQVSQSVRRQAVGIAHMGAHQLVPQDGGEHAPGGEHRGEARHDHALDAELARDRDRMGAGRAAERQQREAPTDRCRAAP